MKLRKLQHQKSQSQGQSPKLLGEHSTVPRSRMYCQPWRLSRPLSWQYPSRVLRRQRERSYQKRQYHSEKKHLTWISHQLRKRLSEFLLQWTPRESDLTILDSRRTLSQSLILTRSQISWSKWFRSIIGRRWTIAISESVTQRFASFDEVIAAQIFASTSMLLGTKPGCTAQKTREQ